MLKIIKLHTADGTFRFISRADGVDLSCLSILGRVEPTKKTIHITQLRGVDQWAVYLALLDFGYTSLPQAAWFDRRDRVLRNKWRRRGSLGYYAIERRAG